MAVLRPPLVPAQDEEAVGRSALRKASLRLLPLIAIGYGIAYMDRINISFAALQMNRDLHFSASVYGFGAGLFFLSYAACEVPSNLLLVRFGARRWLARIMFTWGLLSIGTLFVKTPMEFYVMRFATRRRGSRILPGHHLLPLAMVSRPRSARARSAASISLSRSARSSWVQWPGPCCICRDAGAWQGGNGSFLLRGCPPLFSAWSFSCACRTDRTRQHG